MVQFDVLDPYSRAHPSWETKKAESIFNDVISGRAFYDEMSKHPDYMIYASAELLLVMIPNMITEMQRRNELSNFLVYHIISAVDPEEKDVSEKSRERSRKLISISNDAFAYIIVQLLNALKLDSPVTVERLKRLISFWNDRLDLC